MTTDYKHARFGRQYTDNKSVPQYPTAALREQMAERAMARKAFALVGLVALAGVWAGYEWGYRLGTAEVARAQAIPSAPGRCPASDADQDVIELEHKHNGVVISRECLLVSRPSYVQPRYSMARGSML